MGKAGVIVAHVSPPWANWICDKDGTHIEHVCEGSRELDDTEVTRELLKVLAKMFPKEGITHTQRVQQLEGQIVDRRITRWHSDPCAMGAYSYMRKGATFEDLAAMRDPEPHPQQGPLFFAGEATAPPESMQCVHGAFATGRQAADRILRLWYLRERGC
eukprot:CAMPEP_0206218510 /NCGR_PEP_ID=MMETSP0047_2-20121206/3835_1 /ASSEMBLY_ACC=CAM_ASM_000192 /TAXON_ID=195065 /ORGANISM="Chroomonas mesostigmatica_cf, Strain CCMP1168" /LENGTH=158 /DNA_ID=CAMNT_0053641013 /DNA_START=157 /DNA_END=630 /DNA_ORIENTATION=-